MKTLIIYANPDNDNRSIANKIIVEQLLKSKNIEIRKLYSLYPDFKINVDAEQKALVEADILILQFPLHWYSVPGLLKEWLDKVFLHGFAYGSGGDNLHGKEFIVSTTVGGDLDSYCASGHNHFTIDELLKPIQQTALFTGMKFNKPIISYDMVYLNNGSEQKIAIERRAKQHATELIVRLNNLKTEKM